jgi:hypothetical protein
MKRFVEAEEQGGWDPGLEEEHVNGAGSSSTGEAGVDLGPLLGRERGFRTREKVARAGGIGGVEMFPKGKGKERAMEDADVDIEGDGDETEDDENIRLGAYILLFFLLLFRLISFSTGAGRHSYQHQRQQRYYPTLQPKEKGTLHHRHPQQNYHHQLRPPDPGPLEQDEVEVEDKMPPKMRKRWMHREAVALRETYGTPSMSSNSNHGSTSSSSSVSGRTRSGEGEGGVPLHSMVIDESTCFL